MFIRFAFLLSIMKLLKRLAFAIYPRPRQTASFGEASLVQMPRRVQGARHIEVGDDVIIQAHSWLAAFERYGDQAFQPRIRIGSHTRIGRHAVITAIDSVALGDGCLLSEQVFISDHTHEYVASTVPPHRQPLASRGPVSIGKHCFIGMRACVLSSVTLGDYCVVGANSVVTHSFPAGSIIAGAPARLIRQQAIPVEQPSSSHDIR